MRLLAINGSLRRGSYNAALLAAAAAESPSDVDVVVWRGLADLPAYDEDIDTMPPPLPVAALRAEIEQADAVLIATPAFTADGRLRDPALALALRRTVHELLEQTVERAA
jgi:chromate reductase, NAD(P)H dehydrogenase (quinone)